MVKRDEQNDDVVPFWAGVFFVVVVVCLFSSFFSFFFLGGGGGYNKGRPFFNPRFFSFFCFFLQGVGMMKERVSFVVCKKGSVSSWTRKKREKKGEKKGKKRMVKRGKQNDDVVPVWVCVFFA